MTRPETRQEKLERLADRLCAGEVVFFIGAGFSLDTEGNTTKLLIARLLARFEALAEQAGEAGVRLRAGLRTTFALEKTPIKTDPFSNLFDSVKPATDRGSVLATTLTTLAQNYYLINDWICSAFDTMIDHFAANPPADLAARVNVRENVLLAQYSAKDNGLLDHYSPSDRLGPMDVEWLLRLREAAIAKPGEAWERFVAGKALFLDTLGFDNPRVMAGRPMHRDLDEVDCSTAGRLRTRHHVLAWLAAEGLCPTLVTTNYDLLLECGYRLAGMMPLHPPPELWEEKRDSPGDMASSTWLPLNRRYRHFTRVAEASQFFTHGDARESAVIHKIHGSVETYRRARASGNVELFRKVLPTIVFTFREIQNWREDSWSRDHLTTLMRTRTIVFAGYSGADQVIHDTFRTVYEDVAGYRARGMDDARSVRGTRPGANARAFFTDRDQVASFHGLEILRAASTAAGDPVKDVTDHPNLLTFFPGDTALPRDAQRFPDLDDLFLWMYHLAARELQAQALETEVSRIAYQLFGTRRPDEDARAVIRSFHRLRRRERAQARTFERGSTSAAAASVRRRFRQMTAWTSVFNVALMREYQLAEGLLRTPTDRFPIHASSKYPWYRPLAEHPQWAAWGAILEMAIRRAVACHVGRPAHWRSITTDLEVIDHVSPTVFFRASPRRPGDKDPPVRRGLTVALGTLQTMSGRRDERRLLAARAPIVWELQPETIPWWCHNDDRRPLTTPSLLDVWQWAAGDAREWDQTDLTHFLGGPVVEQQSA